MIRQIFDLTGCEQICTKDDTYHLVNKIINHMEDKRQNNLAQFHKPLTGDETAATISSPFRVRALMLT